MRERIGEPPAEDLEVGLRLEVCKRVLEEMEDSRPELLERVQEVSVEHMLEVVVGEYVRRTRARFVAASWLGNQTWARTARHPMKP